MNLRLINGEEEMVEERIVVALIMEGGERTIEYIYSGKNFASY